jgi:hypothetical protein
MFVFVVWCNFHLTNPFMSPRIKLTFCSIKSIKFIFQINRIKSFLWDSVNLWNDLHKIWAGRKLCLHEKIRRFSSFLSSSCQWNRYSNSSSNFYCNQKDSTGQKTGKKTVWTFLENGRYYLGTCSKVHRWPNTG